MAKMYYESDCNLAHLKNKIVAVIGYGSLFRIWQASQQLSLFCALSFANGNAAFTIQHLPPTIGSPLRTNFVQPLLNERLSCRRMQSI